MRRLSLEQAVHRDIKLLLTNNQLVRAALLGQLAVHRQRYQTVLFEHKGSLVPFLTAHLDSWTSLELADSVYLLNLFANGPFAGEVSRHLGGLDAVLSVLARRTVDLITNESFEAVVNNLLVLANYTILQERVLVDDAQIEQLLDLAVLLGLPCTTPTFCNVLNLLASVGGLNPDRTVDVILQHHKFGLVMKMLQNDTSPADHKQELSNFFCLVLWILPPTVDSQRQKLLDCMLVQNPLLDHMVTNKNGLHLLGELFTKDLVGSNVKRDEVLLRLSDSLPGLEAEAMLALSHAFLYYPVRLDIADQIVSNVVRVITTAHLSEAFENCCQVLTNLGFKNPGYWHLICAVLRKCDAQELVPSLRAGSLCRICWTLGTEMGSPVDQLVPQLLEPVCLSAQLQCYTEKNKGWLTACCLLRKLSTASPRAAAFLARQKCDCLL